MLAVLWISGGVPGQCIATSGYDWDEARELFKRKVDELYPNHIDEVNEAIENDPDFDGYEFSTPLEALWIIDVEE